MNLKRRPVYPVHEIDRTEWGHAEYTKEPVDRIDNISLS